MQGEDKRNAELNVNVLRETEASDWKTITDPPSMDAKFDVKVLSKIVPWSF